LRSLEKRRLRTGRRLFREFCDLVIRAGHLHPLPNSSEDWLVPHCNLKLDLNVPMVGIQIKPICISRVHSELNFASPLRIRLRILTTHSPTFIFHSHGNLEEPTHHQSLPVLPIRIHVVRKRLEHTFSLTIMDFKTCMDEPKLSHHIAPTSKTPCGEQSSRLDLMVALVRQYYSLLEKQ
jgi:hypothetical protein